MAAIVLAVASVAACGSLVGLTLRPIVVIRVPHIKGKERQPGECCMYV